MIASLLLIQLALYLFYFGLKDLALVEIWFVGMMSSAAQAAFQCNIGMPHLWNDGDSRQKGGHTGHTPSKTRAVVKMLRLCYVALQFVHNAASESDFDNKFQYC